MPQYLTDKEEVYKLYKASQDESKIWRRDYQEYERLADNELMDELDESLPEVNDGSLAAALFKLPKRIVSSKLSIKFKAQDRDEAWVSELANIVWNKKIVPNANTQAPFIRKIKTAVRKAAIYGSVSLITIFVERGKYTGADFVVSEQPQDVKLEPGKVSDSDSDIMFRDVYFSKLQVLNMIDRAKREQAEAKEQSDQYQKRKTAYAKKNAKNPDAPSFEEAEPEPYNNWYVPVLEKALEDNANDEREQNESNNAFQEGDGGAKPKGIKFFITQQRGVNAPFCMYYKTKDEPAREWSNPDPTGDTGINFLYCYQDLVNPYGIGIVKLAGGIQNVIDYLTKADVLATQIGIRPPVKIGGNTTNTDLDSMVYEQDAQWLIGDASVEEHEMSTHVYEGLANRLERYKGSLNKLIPLGDTSVSSAAGDPQQSKTPAGVKFQAANLSIDDEDFKDNTYMTIGNVARSMINVHFANMQGSDLIKLADDDRDRLIKAGMPWPTDEMGNIIGNELEVIWDEVRAHFDAEVDVEEDKVTDDQQKLEGLTNVWEMITNPQSLQLLMSGQPIMLGTKRLDPGELAGEIIGISTDNDKILQDVTPEEQAESQQQAAMAGGQVVDPNQPGQMQPGMPQDQSMRPAAQMPAEQPVQDQQPQMDEQAIVQALMQQYRVDENTAKAMRAAELQGFSPQEIMDKLNRDQQGAGVPQ